MIDVEVPSAATIRDAMGAVSGRLANAATRGMAAVIDNAKDDVRATVKSRFKGTPAIARRNGQDFRKSFQGQTYPTPPGQKPASGRGEIGTSLTPAGIVYAKARFARVFEDGASASRGGRGKFAVPLQAAVRAGLSRGPKQTSKGSSFEKRSQIKALVAKVGKENIVTVRAKAGGADGTILGVRAAAAPKLGLRVPARAQMVGLFLLIRSWTLRPRIDVVGAVRRRSGDLQAEIDKRL